MPPRRSVTVVWVLLSLGFSCSTGCQEKPTAATVGDTPLRREEAFQRLAAAGVTLGAAYMNAHDDAGANAAIEVCVELARLGAAGQADLEEAGRIVASIERARGRDGMVTIDAARPIVVRAKALLERSRARDGGP